MNSFAYLGTGTRVGNARQDGERWGTRSGAHGIGCSGRGAGAGGTRGVRVKGCSRRGVCEDRGTLECGIQR